MPKIITFTTDFGVEDGYAAAMKGVILGICPEITLVDISHAVPRHNIRSGAFVLAGASNYFPAGSIHVAVVDPGVGTERRGIILQAGGHYFVGPDNGLFSWIVKRDPGCSARELDQPRYWLQKPSFTFHGRDIFAPVAAHLAAGIPAAHMGKPCHVEPEAWTDSRFENHAVWGEIIHTDHFGNCITNIHQEDLDRWLNGAALSVTVSSRLCFPMRDTYGQSVPGECLALMGSSGFLEIAVNQGSAAELLGLRQGMEVRVTRCKDAKGR